MGRQGLKGADGSQGPPGVNGTAGPPGPPWAGSFAYAVTFFPDNGGILSVPESTPLPFDQVNAQNITSTTGQLTVQHNGTYQLAISIVGFLNSPYYVYLMRNGLRMPEASFQAINGGGPPGYFEKAVVVDAPAGDYFGLETSQTNLNGIPFGPAYSLTIIQLA